MKLIRLKINDPKEFRSLQNGFDAARSAPNAFELEYFIPVPDSLNPNRSEAHARIKIVKALKTPPQLFWENRADFDPEGESLLSRIEVKAILPAYILGYSSGENEILSLPFFKMRFINYDEYKDFLIKDEYYSLSPEKMKKTMR